MRADDNIVDPGDNARQYNSAYITAGGVGSSADLYAKWSRAECKFAEGGVSCVADIEWAVLVLVEQHRALVSKFNG